MSRSKIVFGTAMLLFAAIGAFATAKSHATNIYYINTGSDCIPVEVDFECVAGLQSCTDPISTLPLTGSPDNGETCEISLKAQ